MAKNQHLYDYHFEKQNGKCDECGEDLVSRFTSRLRRIVPGREGGKFTIENTRIICLICEWKLEGTTPDSPNPLLKTVYRSFKRFQIDYGRLDRIIRAATGDIKGTTPSPYMDAETLAILLADLELYWKRVKLVKKALVKMVREQPEWKAFMADAPGMGEITAAYLLSLVNIAKAKSVSALWKFFGFDPANAAGTDGRNPGLGQLRAPLYAGLSITLIRKDSPYREHYDAWKTKGVSHGGALRRIMKLWLSHLWVTWRTFEGLPVTKPFVHDKLDHTTYYSPSDYGWRVKSEPVPSKKPE